MFDVLNRITELREERKLSVYKMAQLSGIPQSTIATWYQKNHMPPVDKIETLCGVFGISLSEFFKTGNSISLTEEQQILLEKWNVLTPQNKIAIISIIDTLNGNS